MTNPEARESASKAKWLGRCDAWRAKDAELFWAFDDGCLEICYRTFRKHLGSKEVKRLDANFGVALSKDWHVKFFKGVFDGNPVVCLMHSAYHYLWTLNKSC
jgi:hypothetical protein